MEELSRTWWVYLIRGVCAILFGLLAIIWPGMTLFVLVAVFGAYAIVNGVFELFSSGRGGSRGWTIFSGVGSILIGLLVLFWPGITALILLLLIASWAVVVGILEVVAAIMLRRVVEGEWMFIVSGVLAVLFGILLFLWPATGALAIAWLIGAMAIVYGISLLALAFRVRGVGSYGPSGRPHPA
ncbi:HdeD family acid-resistance protein [Streptosporangium subroseum]|uniref:HdeD family acid-resistance protein n=1 Tax=Streptosporangium subroseum TaxID=106412 RepID=UPI0030916D21|nr:HdeD family acid-resistance protein [Streptosporangium subroseum]